MIAGVNAHILFMYGSRLEGLFKATHPLLGCLVAEVQCCGVPVHGDVSIPHRGPVVCALYCAAPAEPSEKTNCYFGH